jgi:antitoxin component YwqK of YwqJK toxin-antitoxin module
MPSLTCTSFPVLLALFLRPASAVSSPAARAVPADSTYKSWYFTPTGIYGRQPLQQPKNRPYVKIFHPNPNLATIESFNPANVLVSTSRIYFTNGLISLGTETDRWGNTYDSTWYKPESSDKFLVTERRRGVNPFLPSKYLEYIFKDGLVTEILCYTDSIRAGANQDGVAHYLFERYTDPDRRGLIKAETYNDQIDAPVFSRVNDCHKLVKEYDIKGNLLSTSIFDQNDKPVLNRYGVFRTNYKYDRDDNETEADYFDTKSKPTVTAWGYAEKVRDYKRGFNTTETYYYNETMIVRSTRLADSVAIIWHKYDQQGNETETQYFDPQNNPLANSQGAQKIQYEYSSDGMLMRTVRTGFKEMSMLWDKQLSLWLNFDHDNKGRTTSIRFKSNTGLPVLNPENAALLTKYSYDAWGRIHSISCWWNDSTKMSCALGYQEVVNRYNEDGQLVEVNLNDSIGNPYDAIGYNRQVYRYNEKGLSSELAFFNRDKPALFSLEQASVSNFHRLQYNYDGFNRLRTINYFDENDRPVNAILRSDRNKELKAGEIDLDYDGALLTSETFRISDDQSPPAVLDCTKGQCLPLTAFEKITVPSPIGSVQTRALQTRSYKGNTYHGRIHPDTLVDDQFGFVGRDTILMFLRSYGGTRTAVACSELYRIAPINKYYQFDGQVNDYYIDNDSLAATLTYAGGYLEGPAYLWYKNGQIKAQGIYRKSAKDGIWKYYYDNGQKEKTLQFENGEARLIDCYTRNGEVLASGGNGHFEGDIITNSSLQPRDMLVKGPVKDGVPDGEWNLYANNLPAPDLKSIAAKQVLLPGEVEFFSRGKFKYGVSHSMLKSTYTGEYFSRLESIQRYEFLDHYRQELYCRPQGTVPLFNEVYAQIKEGLSPVVKTKYKDYSGWVFLNVHFNSAGHVVGGYVRLYQPNNDFETDIRGMASHLIYTSAFGIKDVNATYERSYVILVGEGEVMIPEQLVQDQRAQNRH